MPKSFVPLLLAITLVLMLHFALQLRVSLNASSGDQSRHIVRLSLVTRSPVLRCDERVQKGLAE